VTAALHWRGRAIAPTTQAIDKHPLSHYPL
jgi:hypothetical protein